MPRKPRITAIPVDQVQPEEGLVVAMDEKTDAEQMTEILQEVQQEPKEEPKETVSAAPVVVKPKAKRASRAKPKEEPVKEEQKEEAKEEPEEEAKEEPKEEHKGDDKVGCPDCGKQMSAKTLKYSHGPNCSSKKPKTNTDKKEEQQPTIQREEITEELIERHIRTRQRAERATRREMMLNNLMQTAF